ncbi:HAMP domain-containing protein [Deferrisoma sp.]
MARTMSLRALIPIVVAVGGLVAVCSLLLYSGIRADLMKGYVLHATETAQLIVRSAKDAMLKDDRESLQKIVANVGEEQTVEHLKIFNKKGVIVFSNRTSEVGGIVDKSSDGCAMCHASDVPLERVGLMEQAREYVNRQGEPVLAITVPIYNEPGCWNGACHRHPPDQNVLGTLDIGLSTAALQEQLGTLRHRLIGFAVMVTVLCAAGVAALLLLTVIAPVRRLAKQAQAVLRLRGRADLPGGELEVLSEALRLLESGGQGGRPGG